MTQFETLHPFSFCGIIYLAKKTEKQASRHAVHAVCLFFWLEEVITWLFASHCAPAGSLDAHDMRSLAQIPAPPTGGHTGPNRAKQQSFTGCTAQEPGLTDALPFWPSIPCVWNARSRVSCVLLLSWTISSRTVVIHGFFMTKAIGSQCASRATIERHQGKMEGLGINYMANHLLVFVVFPLPKLGYTLNLFHSPTLWVLY